MNSALKKDTNLIKLLIELIKHIDSKNRFKLFLLLILIILSSFAELLSLAMVIPFLSILSNPNIILENRLGLKFIETFSLTNSPNLYIPISIIFCFFVILAGLIRLISVWFTWKISGNIGAYLTSKAYNNLLFDNYEKHLNRNSSNVISTLSIDSTRIIIEILNPILLLISSSFISLTIITALIIINWFVAFFSCAIILIFYLTVILGSKRKIESNGKYLVFLNQDIVKHLQEYSVPKKDA